MAAAFLLDDDLVLALATLPGGAGMTTEGGCPGAWMHAVRLKLSGCTPKLVLPVVCMPPHRLGLAVKLAKLSEENLRMGLFECQASCPAAVQTHSTLPHAQHDRD